MIPFFSFASFLPFYVFYEKRYDGEPIAHHNNSKHFIPSQVQQMADAPFLALLILHIGAIVAWMGGAVLFVSIIIPSLSKMSQASRAEFIQFALPRYLRFISGSSILAIIAGLILYGYIAPSGLGAGYIQAGAVLGLVALLIALGILVPSGRKLVSLVKQTPAPQAGTTSQDPTMTQMARLQRRMSLVGRLGITLLGIALILMIIGAS